MKKINLMAILIAAVLTLCFTFTSCGKDDEKENDIYTGVITGNTDVATAVSGTYTGKRTIGTTVVSVPILLEFLDLLQQVSSFS